MNYTPLVTGIIIFFNGERFFEEAIHSVFAQTYENWELLLVDDGSTDRSTEIARRYANQQPDKVSYLQHQGHVNNGKSASRNLGIQNARGEYIAFLDVDDIWLPNKLEQQVAILESHPEAAMVYGRTTFWFSWTGNPEDVQRDCFTPLGIEPDTLVNPPALLELFLRDEDSLASTCSVLIRREVFGEVGGFEDDFHDQFEDVVLYSKIYFNRPVYVADSCWDKYRQHSENSCHIAEVTGQYHPSKPNPAMKRLLNWLEEYLLEQDAKDTEVWRLLQKNLWPYRHPILYSSLESFRCIGDPKAWLELVIRIGRRTLPFPVRHWLWVQLQAITRRFVH